MDRRKIEELEGRVARDYPNVAGIVAAKRGTVAYEGCFNGFSAGDSVHIYSATKSVVSALFGIAIGEGLIGGVDVKVLDFFPDYAAEAGDEAKRSVAIGHLLSMTAPYVYEAEPYEAFFASPDPIRLALDFLGGGKPAGVFNYSAIGGTHLLSGIFARATGRSLREYAAEKLFGPLGIDVPRDVALRSEAEHAAAMEDRSLRGWAVDPRGLNWASWGLFLRPADMAKIGRLYAQGGSWEGRSVVPRRWIADSLRERSRCEAFGGLGYGYLWWLLGGGRYAALGDGGNAIYVDPAKDLVVAVAGLFDPAGPAAKDSVELIEACVAPALED